MRNFDNDNPDEPPPVEILFRASPKGKTYQKLQSHPINKKSWMRVQCQVAGSYRSANVVEALKWMLPQADTSEESCVVLLDWFNGHLTKEVADTVKKKGHVLLFHGGGTTPFTQVNDTHLHATLVGKPVEQDIRWSAEDRQRLMAANEFFPNRSTTPTQTRYDVLALVQEAWQMVDQSEQM